MTKVNITRNNIYHHVPPDTHQEGEDITSVGFLPKLLKSNHEKKINLSPHKEHFTK